MSLAIFNINDAGIQLTLDGDLLRTSPGYAVLNDERLLVGEKASEQAKLLPRWTNTRFWSQLDTNPLPNSTSQVRHHADLAFAHLEDLWRSVEKQSSENVFIVPGYFSNEQLSLLLGLANECQLPVTGIVDQSVVAASNLPLASTVLHLDIHLHAITLTRVHNAGALVRKHVNVPVEAGLFTLWDRWANIIADQFIQTTRFDPMHTAATEQQLFNQLPAWVASLSDASAHPFTLEANGASHAVTVSRDALMQACTSIYPQIVQAVRSELDGHQKISLLLSHRFAGFPGLRESLALVKGVEVIELPPLKASGSALTHARDIIGEPGGINFVVQLDAGENREQAELESDTANPTHLLWRNEAFPIGAGIKLGKDSAGPITSDNPIATIYSRHEQLTLEVKESAGVTINGEPAKGSLTLSPGDVIRIGDEDLTVISVRDHG